MKKIFIIIWVFLCSGKLFAAPVNEIVFFGDSLSDNGNLYHILKVIPRSPPYYNGRFTNGYTWAELLGKHYQGANNISYSIYAYGGATAYAHDGGSLFAPMTLDAEILEFYAQTILMNKHNKLYVIWIGGNDYLNEESMDPEFLTDQVIKSIFSALADLQSQGAQYFLVLNLPDLSKAPYASRNELTERLHLLTEMHNKKLAQALTQFSTANSQTKAVLVDVYSFFNDLLVNTAQYNEKFQTQLSNLNQACWTGGIALQPPRHDPQNALRLRLQQQLLKQNTSALKKYHARSVAEDVLRSSSLQEAYRVGNRQEGGMDPCEQPEQYIFWDLIHPTAPVHKILAARVLDTLELEAKDLFIG